MFAVIDYKNKDVFTPIKGGFKTAAQANKWCKKNLPKDEVQLWGNKIESGKRYTVIMK